MSLRRIAKLFAAQNTSQIVAVAQQLLLPPAFLHIMGASYYGQWLTLSASVAYLSTFNYGLQTYTNMQMAIHYNRGEVSECQHVMSAGLRILLGAFALAAVLLLVVFLMPLDQWLRLEVSARNAQWTLYLLGLQVMANMIFGFFSNSYLVFQKAHLGAHYTNITQMISVVALVVLVFLHQPFPILAASQVAVTAIMTVLLAIDVGRRCPDIRFTLRYWQPGSLKAILKPSSQYMLLATSNLLVYQVPIILIDRLLGPSVVAIYAISRTIYSMSRRVLFVVTYSLSAEITTLFGARNWTQLATLYDFSERVILLLTLPLTFGSMMATPLLLKVWLAHGKAHPTDLYHAGICFTLAITVSVLSIKEHKYQFQFSSNTVDAVAWQSLALYTFVCVLAYLLMPHFGIQGYLVTWLICETLQLFYLLHLNDRLFAGHAKLNHKPVFIMLATMVVCAALCYWPMHHIANLSDIVQGLIATGVTLGIGIVSYKLFQVDLLREMLWEKLAHRFPSFANRGARL